MLSQHPLRSLARILACAAAFSIAGAALAQDKPKTEPKPDEKKADQKPEEKAPAAKAEATLKNFQTAYADESNAHARYLAAAKKADDEGYPGVASLFRAVARAEEVHAKMLAEEIKKLGGAPKADNKKPELKSTKENLEAAIKTETQESTETYPNFSKTAQEERYLPALKAFGLTGEAEAGHAKLFTEALKTLDSKAPKKEYFVCPTCGGLEEKQPEKTCPLCGGPADKLEKVN